MRLLHAIAKAVLNPRCPLCRCRTRHLAAHIYVDHYGEAA